MTLFLYVLRHAKAEHRAPAGGGDHARPLRPRGQRNARAVGRFLWRLGEVPEQVLSSTAVRARETAEIACEEGDWNVPIEAREALYAATPAALAREVGSCKQGVQRLLLVGHQPGLALLIAELTGSEPDFPTAALARIDLELELWSALRPRSGQLAWLVTPETIAAFKRPPKET